MPRVLIFAFVVVCGLVAVLYSTRHAPSGPKSHEAQKPSSQVHGFQNPLTNESYADKRGTTPYPSANDDVTLASSKQAAPKRIDSKVEWMRFERLVDRNYSQIIAGFALSPEQKSRLKTLLVERYLAVKDTTELVNRKPLQTAGELRRANELTAHEIDNEISALIGTELSLKVSEMIEATIYIDRIQRSYEPRFKAQASPLTSVQVLELALLHKEIYKTEISDVALPTSGGLSESDSALIRAADKTLTPGQIAVLKSILIENRKKMSPR